MDECIVIIGSYINACSIVWALHKINYTNEIYIIEPHEAKTLCMAEVLLHNVHVIKTEVSDDSQIIEIINNNIPAEKWKRIFFTSEEFIEPIRLAIQSNALIHATACTGSGIDNDLIFDRFKFYKFIEGLGHNCTPKTICSDEDPNSVLGESYIVRVNKTWDGIAKLPRLQIVNSIAEKEAFENQLLSQGLTRDMWSYQELLSVSDEHNVSVCGWFDNEFQQFVVTRKVMQHPPKTGNGDVVEVFLKAPRYIVEVTEDILQALKYSGPFEMEFVYDNNSQQYKVIELNPRFWMQHGLVDEVTDGAMIKRAVGYDNIIPIGYNDVKYGVWVNGNRVVYHLLKGNIKILKYICIGSLYPSFMGTLKWMFYYSKYKKALNR